MPDGTILDTILEHKRAEVAARKLALPFAELQARANDTPRVRGFAAALRSGAMPIALDGHADPSPSPFQGEGRGEVVALIAEVKKASPSAGIIRPDFDPVTIAKTYETNGASCLSVLTDERFFQGDDAYLKAIREVVSLPLLRKEFIVDDYQIYESRMIGADAILLIVAALSRAELREFQWRAHGIGLDVLVEVHTEEEMETAVWLGADVVGINTRDLKTFVTDLAVFDRLASMAPKDAILVAESGIRTPNDVARVAASGAQAILVGESLMRQSDIGVAVRELMG